jgi:hypothetical protein
MGTGRLGWSCFGATGTTKVLGPADGSGCIGCRAGGSIIGF